MTLDLHKAMREQPAVGECTLSCARCGRSVAKGEWTVQAQKYEGEVPTGIIGQAKVHAFSETGMVPLSCLTAGCEESNGTLGAI